jgi:hypothetical protein
MLKSHSLKLLGVAKNIGGWVAIPNGSVPTTLVRNAHGDHCPYRNSKAEWRSSE